MSEITGPILEWLNTHPELADGYIYYFCGRTVIIAPSCGNGYDDDWRLSGAGIIPFWSTSFGLS